MIRRIISLFKKLKRLEPETVRDTIEELIEESAESESSIEQDERVLLGNVLSLRDLTARDVMIPRADIIAANTELLPAEQIGLMVENQLTAMPIYRQTLDHVFGMVHIKDILKWCSMTGENPLFESLVRDILFISPSMRTLDLLLQMRCTGIKMALIVDEYGGVDGLVTLGNLVEEIIGDIQDAHDQTIPVHIERQSDESVIADGRANLEAIKAILPSYINLNIEGEMDDMIDTIGGLVTYIAGRVPVRGEIIRHNSGVEFEILQADPRRVYKICIRPVNLHPEINQAALS